MATYEDRLYGVPLYADVSLLLWNKALFEAAGLDPEVPPTNLQEIHDMAAAINDPANGVYGYYLAGNCAGCNIFTFAPLIWASGGTIEPAECGDEALVGDSIPTVLEWARMMHQEGLIDPAAQAETGATFGEVFGSGNVGIMGTGNFNVALAKEQNPDIELGVTLLPGLESGQTASFAGGDIVTVPKGSERIEDAVEFMKFILSDDVQANVYMALGNLPTRTDVEPVYDDPDVADTPRGIADRPDAVHAGVLRDDQLAAGPVAADAPAGVLQRRADRGDHRRHQDADGGDVLRVGQLARHVPARCDAAAVGKADQGTGMKARTKRKWAGVAYVAPALLFVLAFTVYPFVRMFQISLTDESLLVPAEFVGLDNFRNALDDDQFWVAFRFTLKYTVLLTPILMIGGYLLALLLATNTRPRRLTRAVVFIPVVIGLGASSLLWYWLFSPRYGLINAALEDLGIIDEPILWLGVNPDHVAVGDHHVDHVEGHRVRDDPVRRRHPERPEGGQRGIARRRRQRLAAHDSSHAAADDAHGAARHADQRHRLTARLRPVLPDDRRPAAEPDGHVGLLHLPQHLPVPEPRLRRGPVADARRLRPHLHDHPDGAEPAERPMMPRRHRYLVGAVCVALCTVMLLPLLASVLASVKPTEVAAETPPTYLPARVQPRRLPAAVGVPGRAADLPHQQPRHGRVDGLVHPRCSPSSPATGWPASRSRSRSRCSSCSCSP